MVWPLSLKDAFKEDATYRFTFAVNHENVTKKIQVDVNWRGQWDTIQANEVAPTPLAAPHV
jgi:ribosome-associated translation inhibitor RaiA